VVRIEGRLRRVWRFDPMRMEEQAGVKNIYEAWLYNDKYGEPNPACLICTTLPEGIQVSEDVKGEVPVAFVGYFFKRYRYKAADARKPTEFRDVPLLIGHIV